MRRLGNGPDPFHSRQLTHDLQRATEHLQMCARSREAFTSSVANTDLRDSRNLIEALGDGLGEGPTAKLTSLLCQLSILNCHCQLLNLAEANLDLLLSSKKLLAVTTFPSHTEAVLL